jgi:hypothetical protein
MILWVCYAVETGCGARPAQQAKTVLSEHQLFNECPILQGVSVINGKSRLKVKIDIKPLNTMALSEKLII